MVLIRPLYATLEDVKGALDFAETARNNRQCLRALDQGARSVEKLCQRVFYPTLDTRRWDWPNSQGAPPWRLWLNGDEVISMITLVSGGVTIPSTDYILRRGDGRDEPPYSYIEIDLSSNAVFSSGDTFQLSIVGTGLYGHRNDEEAAGTLAEALDATETGIDVSDSAAVGVGSLVRVDSERMLVTGKSMITTGQTLQTSVTAAANSVTVAVTSGAAYSIDEVVLIDSERMLIVDIAGNNLTVKRAWDGTVLAAHTNGATIYAPRTLTVTRGALGTTAATHSSGASLYRHVPPGPVSALNLAEAVNQLMQEGAGYGRQIGTGESARELGGRGLKDLRTQVRAGYARKARHRGV